MAEDADGDILTYTLTATGDNENVFAINWATGQLMTKTALDYEGISSYTVTVRATDPAGEPQATSRNVDNSDEIVVTITVTNVNEPPAVAGQTQAATNNGADLTFNEVVASGNLEQGEISGDITTTNWKTRRRRPGD